MITSSRFAGQRFAVLGLARSGLASVASLAAGGAQVVAWDAREEARARAADVATLADPLGLDLDGFAGIVVSPGVPLNRHPIAAHAARFGVPVIGDIELFAQIRPDLPGHRVVGITGTNGKSTTTALVHHLCRAAGMPTRMGGNIGVPVLGEDALAQGGVYVLELSSYQIDLTYTLACDVAVLINLSPDHLDRYDGFAGYAASKERLFAMQSEGQQAIFGRGDPDTLAIATRVAAQRGSARVQIPDPALLTGQADWPSLQGAHNRENAALAVAVAQALGIEEPVWRPALASFVGLPHRMERVAEADGVLFVNDSKATNPASTAPALTAYPRIHWICGGLPKADNLDECAPAFGHVAAAYTIGEAGPRFAELLSPYMPVTRSEMLCDAVRQAMAAARPGEVIMLSPACASFDQFRDFEARGEAFRQIVTTLIADRNAACPDLEGLS
jgi:UDP-N-acetylmuramoylalanine--D-glutamate ligase